VSLKIAKKKKIKVFGGFNNIELSVDNKKVIDAAYGYVTCSKIGFDSKTKLIILS